MVYLSRIYTKTGDQGETGLGDGSRVPKDSPRVTAYGSIDELNAVLGLMIARGGAEIDKAMLLGIQNDLFDLGADLAVPPAEEEDPGSKLRVRAEQVEQLEKWIDEHNAALTPLTSFLLPGGTEAAAWCHLARTVCRRAERDVVTLLRQETANNHVLVYLNRLSDLLFVLGRLLNRGADVLWVPGGASK